VRSAASLLDDACHRASSQHFLLQQHAQVSAAVNARKSVPDPIALVPSGLEARPQAFVHTPFPHSLTFAETPPRQLHPFATHPPLVRPKTQEPNTTRDVYPLHEDDDETLAQVNTSGSPANWLLAVLTLVAMYIFIL
jgi:hypothetical protein